MLASLGQYTIEPIGSPIITFNIATGPDVEHDDGHLVVLAQRNRSGIHYHEFLCQNIDV
jgi:hypothetical protein